MNRFLLLFIFLLIAVSSCKKNAIDENAPIITIDSPLANGLFYYEDSLKIRGKVTDESIIKSIKISIYDQNKDVEIYPSINYTNRKYEYFIDCGILLNNPSTETGLYYVGITAHDGQYVSKYFVPITIMGKRKKLLGVLCLTSLNQYNNQLIYVDTLNFSQTVCTLSGDNQTSEISSKYGLFFSGGALTGQFSCLDLTTNQILWTLTNESDQLSAWFRNLYFDNSLIYVSTNNGAITGYTIAGTPVKSYVCNNGWAAVQMLDYNGRFFAIVEKLGYSLPQMTQFYSSSGMFLNQQPLNFQPVKMFGKEPGQLLIFGNENGVSKSYIYYFTDNQINSLTVFGSTEIRDVVQINNTQYLVLTSEGVLLYSSDLNVGTTMLCSVTNGNSILYDYLNSQFFVTKSFTVTGYNYPTGVEKSTFTSSKQILKTHLYYNQ